MCGIAGFLYPSADTGSPERELRAMTDAIARRGPDDHGAWLDNQAGVALGHRRLSILELTMAGHQPMESVSGRFRMVFNGEVYDHLELRASLGSERSWRGGSDTETLLAAIEAWGLEETLKRCSGMFALALWDRQTRELTLARDRFGEKPLYYGWAAGRFVFASDLSSILALPGPPPEIDWDAASAYFVHNSVPAPASIYVGVYKLSPGCLLTLRSDNARQADPSWQRQWWSALQVASGPRFQGDAREAVEELERRLSRAVDLQMLADVPVGAFLSGGVDSSLVCALMQRSSSNPVRTFSIGFENPEFNEAPHARAVAAHLGTHHTDLTVTSAMAADLAPSLGTIWSEPFADSSQVPTAILSHLTAGEVTVSLSGDGGDELFCGYDRYQTAMELERLPGRDAIALCLSLLPAATTAALIRLAPHPLARRAKAENIDRIRGVLSGRNPMDRYAQQIYQPGWHGSLLRGGLKSRFEPDSGVIPHGDLLNAYGLADTLEYLPSDILTKVDRAAMAASLETRVPLLDRAVAEFALTLPSNIKRKDGALKWPLRDLLYRHVPRALIDRPKKGFGIPLGDWLRGDLRTWAEHLIVPSDDHFDDTAVARLWQEHQSCQRDWQSQLWRVIMFRSWRQAQADRPAFGQGAPVTERNASVVAA